MPSPDDPIRVVHFTRRFARQCARQGRRLIDMAVCDTLANGSRRVVERRGSRGGPVILFEARHPGKGARPAVRVLGELTRDGCVALLLLSPLLPAKKTRQLRDF